MATMVIATMCATMCATVEARAQTTSDTTIAPRAGAVLDLVMWDGHVSITVWDERRVRVRATHSSSVRTAVVSSDSAITVRSSAARRNDNVVRYEIQVPRNFNVRMVANDAELSTVGATGKVTVSVQHGRVELEGTVGATTVTMFRGPVTIRRARGSISATTLRGDIDIADVRGSVAVGNTDGHIHLADIDGDSVTAASVEGEVAYAGFLGRRGFYSLVSHNEQVRLAHRAGASATIHGFTVNGTFTRLVDWRREVANDPRSMRMVLGLGEATVQLKSFRGNVEVGVQRNARGASSP